MTERLNIQFTGRGKRIGEEGQTMDVKIPVGFISLEDLLSHIEYQLGAGTLLTDELNHQLAEAHCEGRRDLAEQFQALTTQQTAGVRVDMEAAHRIITAELLGYAPTPADGLAA